MSYTVEIISMERKEELVDRYTGQDALRDQV